MASLAVVIPVYNEEGALPELIRSLEQFRHEIVSTTDISQVEFIFVNDGSTDRSGKILSGYESVRLINHPTCLGYGRALKTGFVNTNADFIGFIDADQTYDLLSFVELYKVCLRQNADIAVGSRILGQKKKGFSITRYLGNLFFAMLAKMTTGAVITDATSGMRIFKAHLAPSFYSMPDGLDFALAMTIKALYDGMNIIEVEIPYEHRVGHSKLSAVHDGMRFLRTVLFLSSLGRPFRIFFYMSLLFIGPGLVLVYAPMRIYILHRVVPDFYFYRLTAVVVLFIIGFNLILIGYFSQRLLDKINIRRVFWAKAFGMTLSLIGILFNTDGLYQYFSTGSVECTWVRPLVGAFFVISGIQIYSASIFFRVLRAINNRNEIQMKKRYGQPTI